MREIRRQFRWQWHGIHGAPHWDRVRFHGVALARAENMDAPMYFAVLHDSQRMNDGSIRIMVHVRPSTPHGCVAAD